MRDIVLWCSVVSIMMSLTTAVSGDFGGAIYGLMFWLSGWVIAWGRIRYAP